MHRRTLLLSFPWLCAALGATATARAADADQGKPAGYAVSTEQIQQALAQRFPLRYPVPGVLNLDLQTPRLRLLPQRNRLLAEMAVQASGPALHRTHQGGFDVDFALRYEASDRTLRAQQLHLSRLRFPTLRPEVVDMLNAYAPALAEQSLRDVVLHQLQPQDLKAVEAMGLQPGPITVTETGLVIGLVLKPL
ncbi:MULTISPECIES: DUF1439 domain-containing protein [unclassified Hydrogenophaga]|uniref:DUF1439 domain-containing protein n=1 Tax=unclassified Hydrogenophaga TaxID=2610897 RepID=UPI00087906D4|nr:MULTISPECIES: DUF1439 domain-containing protein [unclassified Hydrogenophaga]MBN9371495.1 DUF1439 domain-containing protein [Hydrogenophaga sp.]OJV71592.1 MAG: DUF1439 domain-containing protein [Hydrogenophaga sp. 70-12]